MSSTQVIVTVVVVVVVVALAVGAWFALRRRALRRRFGPEYDRLVSEQDSRGAAERELRERERLHSQLELRPLSEDSRKTYAAAWEELQARFLDDPGGAVVAGDELVTRLVGERGYPTEDYDEKIRTLSVDHARTLGHYRDAHEIFRRNQRGEAGTEDLRQALVHYRELFADILGEPFVGRPDSADRDDTTAADASSDVEESAGPPRAAKADVDPPAVTDADRDASSGAAPR